MIEWKIKRGTLQAILLAAKNTFPDEFFCLLGGDAKKKEAKEFVVIPAVFGKSHTIVNDWLRPIDKSIVGSAHSHPGSSNFPSKADLNAFSGFGEIHLIVSYPFEIRNARLYSSQGKEIKFELY